MILKFSCDNRLFFYLIAGFIIFTVIGTLTHELGHYIVAKYLGYEARINYASNILITPVQSLYHDFWITLGGPVSTIVIGTIGVISLLIFSKRYSSSNQLTFFQWLLIFFSLFWLRQSTNFIVWIGDYVINGKLSKMSDEIYIAKLLEIPLGVISVFTAILGIVVLCVVLLKFIPKNQRQTFMLAGLVGGIAGYVLWLKIIGVILIP